MNNIFKVIFSQALQQLVVVSELAKGKVKSQSNGQKSISSNSSDSKTKYHFKVNSSMLAILLGTILSTPLTATMVFASVLNTDAVYYNGDINTNRVQELEQQSWKYKRYLDLHRQQSILKDHIVNGGSLNSFQVKEIDDKVNEFIAGNGDLINKFEVKTKISYTANGTETKKEVSLEKGLDFHKVDGETIVTAKDNEIVEIGLDQNLKNKINGAVQSIGSSNKTVTVGGSNANVDLVVNIDNFTIKKKTAEEGNEGQLYVNAKQVANNIFNNRNVIKNTSIDNSVYEKFEKGMKLNYGINSASSHKVALSAGLRFKSADGISINDNGTGIITFALNDAKIQKSRESVVAAADQEYITVTPSSTNSKYDNRKFTVGLDLSKLEGSLDGRYIQEWTAQVGGTNVSKIGNEGKVNYVAGTNMKILTDGSIENTAKLTFKIKDNVKFTTVTTGYTVLNNTGLIIKEGPRITTAGIDAGNKVISNVANGVKNSDAVNKGQLDTAINTVATEAGKHSTVSGLGNITVTPTTEEGKGTNYKVSLNDSIILGSDTEKQIAINGTNGTLSVGNKTKIENGKATFGDIHIGSKDDKGNIVSEISGLRNRSYEDKKTGVGDRADIAATEGQLNDLLVKITKSIDDKYSEISEKSLNFEANDNKGSQKLGSTIKIVGSEVDNKESYSSSNITTEYKSEGDTGTITIKMKEKPNFKQITVKDKDSDPEVIIGKTEKGSGIHIPSSKDEQTVSVTENGLDNGGNKIINIADGEEPTDAVNVRQLTSFAGNLNNQFKNINDHIELVDKNARAGIAGAAALSFLQSGKNIVSAAVGGYRGEHAVAVGYSQISDNGKVAIKIGASVNSRKFVTYGGSVGYQW